MIDDNNKSLVYRVSKELQKGVEELLNTKDMTKDEKQFILEWYYKVKETGAFDKDYNAPFDLTFNGFIDNKGHFHPDENKQVTFHNCRFAEPTDNNTIISIRFDSDYEQV